MMLAIFTVTLASNALIHADGNGAPAWANPGATAVKRLSAIDPVQHQPNFLSNLDCSSMTYRMVGSSTMQTGCFTPTAFGMLDSSNETVIFNGTDEGLPLLSYSPNQVLVPWPKALNLITLDAANTGGSYIGMYKNPLAAMQNQRNFSGQLTAKKLTAPPEVLFKDQAGQRLVVNPQTMAFSDGGSWLDVETLGGSFVRINLASLSMTAFAQAFGSEGSPGALLKSQVAANDDGRYVAIQNNAASSFKVYDLATCGSNVSSWQTSNCKSHEYWPFVNQQIAGLKSIRHVRFINDGLLSFEATTTTGNDGVYVLAPASSITSMTAYIGLGDSYTSGEGAFDYLAGTDTNTNKCHLSSNSYPLLLTRDLFSAAGGHSVACSGAVINDVSSGSDSYKGQVSNGASLAELEQGQPAYLETLYANYSPGYIAQHLFLKRYQPQVVTVSIGGNDIGFGDMLQKCVMPHVSRHLSDSTCYGTYESRLEMARLVDRTVPRWTALYKQLQAESPASRIYAIGYPSIASDLGECPLNVNLGKGELEFAEELIAYLNNAISQSAAAAGVQYVDISQALAGHRLCEASGNGVAVNGLTAGNDFGVLGVNVLGRESYHPNALGHALIEQAILQQTHNLSNGSSGGSTTGGDSGQNLLNAPKSGRTINVLVPDNTITNPILKTGSSASLRVDGLRDGLQTNTTYSVRLDGPSGEQLTSLQSDASGNLVSQINIPADSEPGGHTIDITGSNQAGEPIDITEPVYIAVTDDDIDDVCDSLVIPAASSIPPDYAGTGSGSEDVTSSSPAGSADNNSSVPAVISDLNDAPKAPNVAALIETSGSVASLTPGAPTVLPVRQTSPVPKKFASTSKRFVLGAHVRKTGYIRRPPRNPKYPAPTSPHQSDKTKLGSFLPLVLLAICCWRLYVALAQRKSAAANTFLMKIPVNRTKFRRF